MFTGDKCDSDITVVKIKPDPEALEPDSSKMEKDENVSQSTKGCKAPVPKREETKIVVESRISRSKSRGKQLIKYDLFQVLIVIFKKNYWMKFVTHKRFPLFSNYLILNKLSAKLK